MHHNVQVDQSIKIEQPGNTVLAFSNGISWAVVISPDVKRDAIRKLRASGKSKDVAHILVLAAGVYLLLADFLDELSMVVIDTEYVGYDALIRAFMLRHIWQQRPTFDGQCIMFAQVGKKSSAHAKANAVRRRQDKDYRQLQLQEVLRLL